MPGKSYPQEYRDRICERVHSGEPKTHIEQETRLTPNTILKWYRQWCGHHRKDPVKFASAPKPSTTVQSPEIVQAPAMRSRPVFPTNAIVLAIPDLHCPFEHPDALAFLCEVRRVKQTNATVCLGDEIDAAAFSRYIPDPDGMSPGQELTKAIEHLLPIYREFPNMLVCESNHTVRPFKKAYDAGLPASFLPTYASLLRAPDGWHWFSRIEIDGVLYIHGDNGKSGQYAAVNYMKSAKKSVVIGHIHSYASVFYEATHFAVNAGCLIDDTAYCFKYAKNMLLKVNLGCAVIYEGKYAEFIPMRTDQHGRWIGKL